MITYKRWLTKRAVMKSRAGPSGGGDMGMKCRNMFESKTTKITPSRLGTMIVAIFIVFFLFFFLLVARQFGDSFARPSGTATIRDTTAEGLPISLRKTGKRLHAICKPGLWPREAQSLPAPSCII